MPLQSGVRLGAYEILSALGAGGMGEVYRARDTNLKREVAVKVLPTDGVTAIVLELVEGQTLAERIASSRTGIPLDEALAVARQIGDALEASLMPLWTASPIPI